MGTKLFFDFINSELSLEEPASFESYIGGIGFRNHINNFLVYCAVAESPISDVNTNLDSIEYIQDINSNYADTLIIQEVFDFTKEMAVLCGQISDTNWFEIILRPPEDNNPIIENLKKLLIFKTIFVFIFSKIIEGGEIETKKSILALQNTLHAEYRSLIASSFKLLIEFENFAKEVNRDPKNLNEVTSYLNSLLLTFSVENCFEKPITFLMLNDWYRTLVDLRDIVKVRSY